ncbi:glycosyltransferase family 2 protein [Bordetella holmesii]|uniref:Glycosyltransferase, group 2 family protein n=2 Tax=Bordetella holmesii TaxID=35814 RepID=A0A158M9H5_9BORD|nr:glycosyltransferase family A protein [Bordetella holmesii]AHV93657.1 glycosyl transferase 2 family protein [Bordetella holmesii ATCC 51541]AIT25023.1 glycosyl transferase 2 family protein [Bordetella holmesii 44057]EWM45589.1 glycosyl transferase 2 family protein [Bordetella holmesii 70147]EWM48564.1 glycosyl transferase 2 family protein [Bordetella holmesii 41130]EWM49710.1 glycosyl transferase 2 family protein [Bordetella holmesii 35009]
MDKPAYRFTVLTPTYNRAAMLHRVYQSLVGQTLRDFEWLIVDDGSTDNTEEIVGQWQARSAFPIRYVWQNNQHKKTAFNQGVKQAHGELIVALDSDDEMTPDALAILDQAWRDIPAGERAGFVAVTGLCARPDGRIVGDRFPSDVLDSNAVEMYFRYRVQGEKFGCMRTDVLRQFPFPQDVPGFVPESLVWWAIARAGYRSRFINRVVRIYHDSADSLSQGQVSAGGNAQGLYLLAWDMLQHHTAQFRFRPKGFLMAAARYTRFRLLLKHAARQTAAGTYRLTHPVGRLLAWLMWPLGYLLYLRDRARS